VSERCPWQTVEPKDTDRISPEMFNASKSTCDVSIGTNRFVGDLNRYHVTATIEEISVDIELTGQVRAWRPKSGHLYFGAEGSAKLFAWLPSVPNGLATVRYRIGDEEHRASGSGYHDHNWGDVPMQTLIHNWYCGARQCRSLYDHRVLHHSDRGPWL
jgi:hypothetical protein